MYTSFVLEAPYAFKDISIIYKRKRNEKIGLSGLVEAWIYLVVD